MSLIKQFTSLPHTKILMVEVSSGKKKALLQRIAKSILKDFLKDKRIYKEVLAHMNKNNIENLDSQEYLNRFFQKGNHKDEIEVEQYVYGILKIFEMFEEVDPTSNMKYGNWIINIFLPRTYLQGDKSNWSNANSFYYMTRQGQGYLFDDLPKLESYLKYYDEAKRKHELPDSFEYEYNNNTHIIKNPSDINQILSLDMLRAVTEEYRSVDTGDFFGAVKSSLEKGKDYLVKDELTHWLVYKPLTQKGASILGMNTEWCTTYGEHCTNPDWRDRDSAFGGYEYQDLLIFVNKKDPDQKYQVAEATGEFRDQHDEWISLGDVDEEFQQYIIENDLMDKPNWLEKDEKGWKITRGNIGEFFGDWVKKNDGITSEYIKNIVNGEGYQYFDYYDYTPDLQRTYITFTDESIQLIKEEMFEIIKEYAGEFKESEYSVDEIKEASSFDDLADMIIELEIFNKLKTQIQIAISEAQANADEGEAMDTIIDAFKDEWGIYDINWSDHTFYVDDETAMDFIIAYNDQYSDKSDELKVSITIPYNGWSGRIVPEYLEDYLKNRLYEI